MSIARLWERVKQVVEALEQRGGLYLSDEIKAEALKLAGE